MSIRLFLLIACCFFAFDKPKLVKTKVATGITVSLPKDWRPMDNMDFTERYPSVRAPLAAYTNQERSVDFSVNISATQWPDANLDVAKQFFKSSVVNMFDRVDMIGEGTKEVKGRKYIYFEFTSRVNGNRAQEGLRDAVLKYSYIQYLIEPRRTLVFSFNCPQRAQEEWRETAKAMMNSIKID
ncbi:hypothetical protein [Chryseosolibacter indicus]|uniref:PsbP C-terminal domain-containing protein n=1 Tax=Chryseosolibacter indicus TaxID=2782351 RepID=A0ABS5VWE1_9BACT|nr:hypothetical protein [Chryseosolibacter indicus]MBT1705747.1 hypothetical protein [Chryseosolibacter indicus]